MSKSLVTILWSIAGLLAAFTLIVKTGQSKEDKTTSAHSQGDSLLKELAPKKIATIKIEDAENSVTLKRDEGQWSVVERGDYAVDFPKLARLLRTLTDMTVSQSQKAGPAFNSRFGMDGDAENQEDHGYHVTFLNEDGKELKSLLVGKNAGGQSSGPGLSTGKYVRLLDDPESVYAVNEAFQDLTAEPAAWLEQEFISINGIRSIEMNPGKESRINDWIVSRPNAGSDFTILNLSKNRQPQADKLTPLKSALSAPGFDDVLSEDEVAERRDETKINELTIKTFEGFTYIISYAPQKSLAETPDGNAAPPSGFITQVTVSAEFPTEREKKEGESEEEAKEADASFAAKQKELQKKLAKEQKYNGRSYLIPNYAFSSVNVGLDILAKPVAKTEAIAPTLPEGAGSGVLAPPSIPTTPAPPTPAAPPTSVTSPPIQVPSPAPVEESEPEKTTSPPPEKAEETKPSSNNSDALNGLTEEDIKRIVEEAKKADSEQ